METVRKTLTAAFALAFVALLIGLGAAAVTFVFFIGIGSAIKVGLLVWAGSAALLWSLAIRSWLKRKKRRKAL